MKEKYNIQKPIVLSYEEAIDSRKKKWPLQEKVEINITNYAK